MAEMVMILNFLEFDLSCLKKCEIITISTTYHISSPFVFYSNPCTYLETSLIDLSYTEFSVQLNCQNLSKRMELSTKH